MVRISKTADNYIQCTVQGKALSSGICIIFASMFCSQENCHCYNLHNNRRSKKRNNILITLSHQDNLDKICLYATFV